MVHEFGPKVLEPVHYPGRNDNQPLRKQAESSFFFLVVHHHTSPPELAGAPHPAGFKQTAGIRAYPSFPWCLPWNMYSAQDP